MREIKFRAFADGKMHFNGVGRWWYFDCYTGYWSLNIGDSPGEIICDSLESEDPHLMQNTGLKDKNDKEIYEGDIVTVDEMPASPHEKNYTCEVVFDDGCFGVESDKFKMSLDAFVYQYPDNGYKPLRIEVVGNIYNNPELLG